MVRRTDPKDDNWHNVKDAKKRKQIQDRLAQRARRQRLRQTNIDAKIRTARSERTQHAPPSDSDSSLDLAIRSCELTALSTGSSQTQLIASVDAGTFVIEGETSVTPNLESDSLDFGLHNNLYFDHWMKSTMDAYRKISPLAQPNHPFTVYSALYINGELQGIPCAMTYSARTPAPTPSIPLPLHPTEMQLMIVHPRWIDRLPFPRMRDSLIKLRGVVDEEEIIKDIFTMPSWTITAGQACWDPRAWKMEKEWAGKWGWLMV